VRACLRVCVYGKVWCDLTTAQIFKATQTSKTAVLMLSVYHVGISTAVLIVQIKYETHFGVENC
jgi:hypothetical protein